MAFTFRPAVKTESKLRLALAGPAGAGKTYTMLALLTALAEGQPVAVIDTEHGSASKYSDLFGFDVLELDSFHPQNYIDAIKAAEQAGYAALGIDSMSHAWMGKDGALELVDRAAARSQSKNSYMAWRDVTPLQTSFIDAIIASRLHVIATLRTKTEYVIETTATGKSAPRKVGLAPVQRDQVEYEFDVYGEMTVDNELIVGKTRCPALAGRVFPKPGAEVAGILKTWLSGAPAQERANGQPEVAPRPIAAAPRQEPPPDLATPAQVRAIYLIGRDQHGMTDEQVDERSVALYGTPPADLSKKQAAELITKFKGGEQPARSQDQALDALGHDAPQRDPSLASLWAKAEKAVAELRKIDNKPPPLLPPDDADQLELESFVSDCRGMYSGILARKKNGGR